MKIFMYTLFFSIFVSFSVMAVTLRNGKEATQERVDQVWPLLEELNVPEQGQQGPGTKYYWLWRTCVVAEKIDANKPCNIGTLEYENLFLKKMESETIKELHELRILHDNTIDVETRDIVLASYVGTLDPKMYQPVHPVTGMERELDIHILSALHLNPKKKKILT